MQRSKFNGLLAEIAKRYPDINVSEFLQERLQLPPDKADELAARIENEHFEAGRAAESFPSDILQEQGEPELAQKPVACSLDILSDKEFRGFIEWLLEQLGYEVQPAENQTTPTVALVASRDGEKIMVQALKPSGTCKITNSIVSVAQQAKNVCGCNRSLVIATAYFTKQATAEAERLGIELWNRDLLSEKIVEAKKSVDLEARSSFPQYQGSLLQSLLRLDETKDFFVEPRTEGKYDVYLSGVKFPLLTFQAQGGEVTRCVYRIKNNQPVAESEGTALIGRDEENSKVGPDDPRAYALIIQFLEEFIK